MNKNRKIFFLINSLTAGGAERVLSIILSELNKQNYDIELICLEKNNFYTIPKNIKITYLSNNNGNEHPVKKLLMLPFLAISLQKYIKKNNISIIQSHVYRANFVNSLSKLFGSKHTAQIVNAGQVSMYKTKGFIGKVNLFLIKKLYPMANTIICKSKGMEIDLQTYFQKELNSIVINNPYDIEKIKLLKDEKIDNFTFNKEKTYLIYVGRFASFKKPEYIIKALKGLNEDIELILLGDGPNRTELENLSISLTLSHRVHFLGRVENPYKYIFKSDIFILSSDDGEGFPNVLVEAMICQTSVIATDCKSGPREILSPKTDITFELKDGLEIAEHGILVPKSNVKFLREAITLLLLNKALKEKLISSGYERAKDFSVDKIITQYKKVLELE